MWGLGFGVGKASFRSRMASSETSHLVAHFLGRKGPELGRGDLPLWEGLGFNA